MINAGRLAEAAPVLREIVRRDPFHHEAFQYLAIVGLQSGDAGAARDAVDRAIILRPDVVAYRMLRAASLHMSGAFADARAELAGVLAQAPGNWEALNNAGVVERDDGRFAEAESFFRRALEARPDFADAMYNLAKLKARAGKIGEASGWLSRAQVFRPQDPRSHVPLVVSAGPVAVVQAPATAPQTTKPDTAYRALEQKLRDGSVVPVPQVKILGATSSPLYRGSDSNQLFAALAAVAIAGFVFLPIWGGVATSVGLLAIYELALPRYVARKLVRRIRSTEIAADPAGWERIWATGGLALVVSADGRRIQGPGEGWRSAVDAE